MRARSTAAPAPMEVDVDDDWLVTEQPVATTTAGTAMLLRNRFTSSRASRDGEVRFLQTALNHRGHGGSRRKAGGHCCSRRPPVSSVSSVVTVFGFCDRPLPLSVDLPRRFPLHARARILLAVAHAAVADLLRLDDRVHHRAAECVRGCIEDGGEVRGSTSSPTGPSWPCRTPCRRHRCRGSGGWSVRGPHSRSRPCARPRGPSRVRPWPRARSSCCGARRRSRRRPAALPRRRRALGGGGLHEVELVADLQERAVRQAGPRVHRRSAGLSPTIAPPCSRSTASRSRVPMPQPAPMPTPMRPLFTGWLVAAFVALYPTRRSGRFLKSPPRPRSMRIAAGRSARHRPSRSARRSCAPPSTASRPSRRRARTRCHRSARWPAPRAPAARLEQVGLLRARRAAHLRVARRGAAPPCE